MSRLIPVLLVGAALLAAPQAHAGEISVSQKDKTFAPESVSVKVGDTVKFLNDDDVTHNVIAKSPAGDSKNNGAQKPGETVSVVFDKPGDHEVRCGIHPKMKMTVKVQ